MHELSAEDVSTIRVALTSYADWLTKQRKQAERDRRRYLSWACSDRMGRASRETYYKQAEDIARYMAARDARIDKVVDLIDRLAPEGVAA